MDPERRQAFDDVLRGMRAGRMTRRTFLWRMGALGVGAAATLGLLEAVGGRHITYVVWRSEHDATGTYSRLVDAFNASNHSGIHVTYVNGPPSAGELYSDYTAMLQPNSGSTDILSLDVTWVVPFAQSAWLYALDHRWSESARAQYLRPPFQACTYGTHVFAAPYRVDAGMLYYRTDLVSHAPATWQDLASASAPFQHAHGGPAGFVWTGQPSEGLACLFEEVLASYGGSVLQPGNPYAPAVGSDAGQQALETMVGWVGTASPKAVLGYADYDALMSWLGGNAVFLRNWASAHPQPSNVAAAAVLGRYAAVPMLASAGNGAGGHSSLGGWQLGINAFSHSPDACWEFAQYLLAPASQKQAALSGSILPTAQSVYADADVREKQPFLAQVLPAIQGAQARPLTPLYPQVSQTVQQYVAKALTRDLRPEDALARMHSDLQAICDHAPPLPNAPQAPLLF